MFQSRKVDLAPGHLSLCRDALRQNTNRANYQAAIWKRSLNNLSYLPNPTDGHGLMGEDGQL